MPRSKRETNTVKLMTGVPNSQGDPTITVTEYPWRVSAGQVEQEESLLPPTNIGSATRNGRTDAMNRRP